MHNSVIRAPLVQKIDLGSAEGLQLPDRPGRPDHRHRRRRGRKWKTLAELLADAKKRPGALSWGNVGAISVNRIYAERLAKSAGASST